MTIPIAPVAGLAAGLSFPAEALMRGDWLSAAYRVCSSYTGYDPQAQTWSMDNLKRGLMPLMIGFAIHWIAGKIGVNRMLGRAKIPLIRI